MPGTKIQKGNAPLPLYPGARMCINSGYCCRQAPCPFGEWDEKKHQCKHLTEDNKCGIYEEIIARPVPEWYVAPAFGAGCCSPLNPDRLRMLGANTGRTGSDAAKPLLRNPVQGRDAAGDDPGKKRGSGKRDQ